MPLAETTSFFCTWFVDFETVKLEPVGGESIARRKNPKLRVECGEEEEESFRV